jgi:HAAS
MGADLITEYIDVFRARVRSRRDADDLVAEVEDHLRAGVEALVRDGRDDGDAARVAIESFGDPNVVARAHLMTTAGTLAVPTEGTRAAGRLAVVSAGLWLLLVALWGAQHLLELLVDWESSLQPLFFLGVLVLVGASGLTCAVAFAIRDRHGRALGAVGVIGLGALLVGAASTLVIGWAVPVWMTLLGIGAGCVSVAILRRPIAPRLAAVLLGVALPTGAATFVAARALELGSPDEFGDYPIATLGGLAIGRWLGAEQPFADFEATLSPPA